MTAEPETSAMRRAVALAARGLGFTSPNPIVGCVVLDRYGAIAGEGFHAYAGGPHAEVVALTAAGRRAVGGTLCVTLEPCSHTGRTGPCTEQILAAGISRVVVAVTDPNSKAAGGAAVLRAAGVHVEIGVLADEAERGNAAWLTYIRRGRPYVTWKFAASLDGRSAAADGTSQWITGESARADVHLLRSRSDAIIAGSGTVLADDPRLTARRGPNGPAHEITREDATWPVRELRNPGAPLRVVVDSRARIPLTSRVLDDAAPTLVAVAEDADTTRLEGQAAIVRLPRNAGSGPMNSGAQRPPGGTPPEPPRATSESVVPEARRRTERRSSPARPSAERTRSGGHPMSSALSRTGLDIGALLAELHAREIVSALLEGGPTLAGAFWAAGYVDRVIGYLAPVLLGEGPGALGPSGVPTLAAAHLLRVEDVTTIGPDLRITATRRRAKED